MDTKGWSTEIPTKGGMYWLFGWLYKEEITTTSPKFNLVEVWEIANGFSYVSHGTFVERKRIYGVWRDVETPPLPPMVMTSCVKKDYRFREEEIFYVELDPEAFPDLIPPKP